MAGALPAEEYKTKLMHAGFHDVGVTVTKPHELNIEVIKNTVNGMTMEELAVIGGIAADALITALK